MQKGICIATAILAALAAGAAMAAPATGTATTAPFGRMPDGQAVKIYTLTNKNGLTARITDYGAIVVSLKTPDRNGKMGDILLGFNHLSKYIKESPYFGAIVGRYGNRIGGAKFTLDGKTYKLAKNEGPNILHGGPVGFDKVVWKAHPFVDAYGPGLALTHVSPDGDQGFPGTLTADVTYRLTNDNRLTIDYRATTDKPTVVNLTFHGYFNLSGKLDHTILDEVMQINASRFTPVNAQLIPTGELRPVKGTPFDFTHPKPIGRDIHAANRQIEIAHGYDQNFVLDKPEPGALSVALRVYDPSSGRVMTEMTTQPGVQFYTGNGLNDLKGKGVVFHKYDGFAVEAQHFPDSPNEPKFPSTVLRPGQVYTAHTEYDFSVQK